MIAQIRIVGKVHTVIRKQNKKWISILRSSISNMEMMKVILCYILREI